MPCLSTAAYLSGRSFQRSSGRRVCHGCRLSLSMGRHYPQPWPSRMHASMSDATTTTRRDPRSTSKLRTSSSTRFWPSLVDLQLGTQELAW